MSQQTKSLCLRLTFGGHRVSGALCLWVKQIGTEKGLVLLNPALVPMGSGESIPKHLTEPPTALGSVLLYDHVTKFFLTLAEHELKFLLKRCLMWDWVRP